MKNVLQRPNEIVTVSIYHIICLYFVMMYYQGWIFESAQYLIYIKRHDWNRVIIFSNLEKWRLAKLVGCVDQSNNAPPENTILLWDTFSFIPMNWQTIKRKRAHFVIKHATPQILYGNLDLLCPPSSNAFFQCRHLQTKQNFKILW